MPSVKNPSIEQIVVVSDLHVGSKVGLQPPIVYLSNDDEYHANPLQLEAWNFWEKDFWPFVWERGKKCKTTTVIVNGEGIDGDHHSTNLIWTRDIMEQATVAIEILEPVRKRANSFFVLRGTAAHVGSMGAADEHIAKKLKATAPGKQEGNRRSAYHLKLIRGGVLFDIAHHGPNPGRRMWTYGNELRSYCRTILLDCLVTKRRPPDAIIRSHIHHKVWETVRDYGHKCEAFLTPAWQWKTEFAHKVVSHEDVSDVGGLIIDVADGKIVHAEFKIITFSQTDFVE